MSHAKPFYARLKPKNREFLSKLKVEYGVRSDAAALNRFLDRGRQPVIMDTLLGWPVADLKFLRDMFRQNWGDGVLPTDLVKCDICGKEVCRAWLSAPPSRWSPCSAAESDRIEVLRRDRRLKCRDCQSRDKQTAIASTQKS